LAAALFVIPFFKSQLVFSMLDVGQGDALYIRSPEGRQVLIDAGPGPQVLEQLGKVVPFFDKTIDLFFITHPHLDHFGGAQDVLSHYRVKALVITGVANGDPAYLSLLADARARGIPILFPDQAHDFQIGADTFLDVLFPFEGYSLIGQNVKNKNETSLVMRLLRREAGVMHPLILLTGDAEKEEEELLLQSGQDLHADILKVGHHGGNTSSWPDFLKAVSAKTAVVSVGLVNKYGHPNPEAMKRLEEAGLDIHMTKDEGTISFEWD
jgi:competence protein ComEC